METFEMIIWILFVIIFVIFCLGIFYITPLKNKYKNSLGIIDSYKNRYLTKQGFTKLYNNQDLNYHLLSFDYGKVWYVIDGDEYFKSYQVVILGEVETLYPGLMKHLDAWDNLHKHVSKFESIDNAFDTECDFLNTVKNCGFEITKKSTN